MRASGVEVRKRQTSENMEIVIVRMNASEEEKWVVRSGFDGVAAIE